MKAAGAEPFEPVPSTSMLPSFEIARLPIRPRTLADTDACLAMDRDPEVVRFVDGPWSDPAAHRAFIEARTRDPYPAGLGYWAVLHRDGHGDVLGWVLLTPLDARGPEVEIGWRLRRAVWGWGCATEAAAAVPRHGLGALRLPKVVADIDPANAASARVSEKIGMRPVGATPYLGRIATRYAATPAAQVPA